MSSAMTQPSDDTECISADSERCNTSALGAIALPGFGFHTVQSTDFCSCVYILGVKCLQILWNPVCPGFSLPSETLGWGMESELAVSWRKPPPRSRILTPGEKVLSIKGWQSLQIKRRHKRSLAGRALGRSIPLQAKAAPVLGHLRSLLGGPRLQQCSSNSTSNKLQQV